MAWKNLYKNCYFRSSSKHIFGLKQTHFWFGGTEICNTKDIAEMAFFGAKYSDCSVLQVERIKIKLSLY